MALMPKRVKHRKSQRGRIKGSATRGNTVVFGDYGIQSLEPGWVKATTIEAGRIAAQQYVRGEGKLYIRIFPDKSVSSTPLETRMGKGKGEPDFWARGREAGHYPLRTRRRHGTAGEGVFCTSRKQASRESPFCGASVRLVRLMPQRS